MRVDMSMAESERVSELLLQVPDDVADALRDQVWLAAVLIEQRRRVGVSERDRFTARANRLLAQLDPQEEQ